MFTNYAKNEYIFFLMHKERFDNTKKIASNYIEIIWMFNWHFLRILSSEGIGYGQKIIYIKTGTSDQTPINVRLGKQLFGIIRLDTSSV